MGSYHISSAECYPPPRPCSSVYSQDVNLQGENNFSLEKLVQKVDKASRVSKSNTLQMLLQENQSLQESLNQHRRALNAFIAIVDEMMDLALLIRGSLEEYDNRIFDAERTWLTSLGAGQEWI